MVLVVEFVARFVFVLSGLEHGLVGLVDLREVSCS